MSRRARASKEGTFLESVKVELQKLSTDLAEVKSAMRSLSDGFMGSASMHVPASQYDWFHHPYNLIGDWESYEAWNGLGFEKAWEAIGTSSLDTNLPGGAHILQRSEILAYRSLVNLSGSAPSDYPGESPHTFHAVVNVAAPGFHQQWRPSQLDIFSHGSPLSIELAAEAATVLQRFWRSRGNRAGTCTTENKIEEPVSAEWITTEPKRPPSAYFLFVQELREPAAHAPTTWANLPETERSSWVQRAEHLKQAYATQWEQHRRLGKYSLSKEKCPTDTPSAPMPDSSNAGGHNNVPDTLDCHGQMKTLKPHVMKLLRQTTTFDASFPESVASTLYDQYFSGVELKPSSNDDLEYLDGFLRLLDDQMTESRPVHQRT